MSNTPRERVDVDALENELRKLHESQRARANNNSLAELARIVQHDDPFAIAGSRRSGATQAAPAPAAAPPAGAKSAEQRLAEFRAMLDQRIPRAAPQQPLPAPEPIRVEPRFEPAQARQNTDIAFDLDDDLLPKDIRLPPPIAELRDDMPRRSSPLIRVALPIIALAVIGGGAYYAYARLVPTAAPPQTASAPLIKAPETPAKVAPPEQVKTDEVVQASKVLEPKAEDPKAPQAVVSTVEQPVDLKEAAPAKEAPRVIPLADGQGAPVIVLPEPKPLPAAKPAEPAVATAEPPKPAIEAPKPAEPAAPLAEAPKPPEPASAPQIAAVPEKPVETPAQRAEDSAKPDVLAAIIPEPAVETPAAPQADSSPGAVTTVPSLMAISRTARMKAVDVPTSLTLITAEELPGPGIQDKPRRVKSIRIDTTDPALTRSVRSQATPVPAAAEPAAAPELAAVPEVQQPAAPAVPEATAADGNGSTDVPPPALAAAEPDAAAPVETTEPEPAPKPVERKARRASAEKAKPAPGDGPISLEPDAAPAPRVATAETGSGGFAVQFSAPNTQEDANAEVARVRSRFAAALNGASPRIVRAEVNGRTVYRVRAGGLSRAAAAQLCSEVKAAGGNCFVSNTN